MNTAFEVLPFGGGEMELELELERHSMRAPRGQGRPGKHLSFRGRQALRRAIASPWPYYDGPGWPSAVPVVVAPIDDSDDVDDTQGELGGCNCPKCRQRATAFEVLPFG